MKNQSYGDKRRTQLRMPAFCLLLFLLFFVVGCSSDDGVDLENTPVITQGASQDNPVSVATPTEQPIEFELSELEEVFFYTVNPDTLETEAVSSVVKTGFAEDPMNLIVLIGDSLEDAGYEVGIQSAVLDGENVVVNFMSDTCPVTGLTESEEKAVLDAIAQSLLDNFMEQSGVVFQIMGAGYESDNFSFREYYVYMKNYHK